MFPGDDIKNTFNSTGEIRVTVESMDHVQKFHVGVADTRYSVTSGLCWMILRAELELMLLVGLRYKQVTRNRFRYCCDTSNHF